MQAKLNKERTVVVSLHFITFSSDWTRTGLEKDLPDPTQCGSVLTRATKWAGLSAMRSGSLDPGAGLETGVVSR